MPWVARSQCWVPLAGFLCMGPPWRRWEREVLAWRHLAKSFVFRVTRLCLQTPWVGVLGVLQCLLCWPIVGVLLQQEVLLNEIVVPRGNSCLFFPSWAFPWICESR